MGVLFVCRRLVVEGAERLGLCLRLTLGSACALMVVGSGGCASGGMGKAASSGAPREIPTRCPQGPNCVAGEANDLFGEPLPGVRCIVRTAAGPPAVVETDAGGFFLIDGLVDSPSFIQFEGPGVVGETKTLVRTQVGEASRVFVVLARRQGGAQVPSANRR